MSSDGKLQNAGGMRIIELYNEYGMYHKFVKGKIKNQIIQRVILWLNFDTN